MLETREGDIQPQDLVGSLEDEEDAAVSEVSLVGVVLHVAQTSQDLEGFAHTRPASLWAEDLSNEYSHSWETEGHLHHTLMHRESPSGAQVIRHVVQ